MDLEQLDGESWITIAFASKFLHTHEKKFSTNELDFFRSVLGNEHFKIFLRTKNRNRKRLSVLNASLCIKFMHSRLTFWVNRLLSFNFKIELIPGKEMGFTDLLSRLHSGKALPK